MELLATVQGMQEERRSSAAADSNGAVDVAAAPTSEQGDAIPVLVGPAARPVTDAEQAQTTESAAAAAAAADDGVHEADAASAAPAAKRRRVQDSRPGNKNSNMHPRSRYAQHEPDFAALAAKHPGLAEFAALRPDGRFQLP